MNCVCIFVYICLCVCIFLCVYLCIFVCVYLCTCSGNLLTNPECAKTYTEDNFRIIGEARSSVQSSGLESVYIKTQNPVLCKQKDFIFSLGIVKYIMVIGLIGHSCDHLDSSNHVYP